MKANIYGSSPNRITKESHFLSAVGVAGILFFGLVTKRRFKYGCRRREKGFDRQQSTRTAVHAAISLRRVRTRCGGRVLCAIV
ncbi:MAG: hypothetical protein ABIL58_09750 [Pseudomonadota bacterium]